MALYLQLDGVDDYIKTPSITFDEVIMDFKARPLNGRYYFDGRTGTANSFLFRNTSGLDTTTSSSPFANGMYVNGVKVTNQTTFIPNDVRVTLRLAFTAPGTDDVNLFSNNTNITTMSADVFNIKFLLSGVVQVHYDMTTGTVQDQSGNGKHATLTGGTWLDDGTGGSTGTSISSLFNTKQVISIAQTSAYSTKQTIPDSTTASFSTKQSIFSNSSDIFDTEQTITAEGNPVSVNFSTKQSILLVRSNIFDTEQAIKADFRKIIEFGKFVKTELILKNELVNTEIVLDSYLANSVFHPSTLQSCSEITFHLGKEES